MATASTYGGITFYTRLNASQRPEWEQAPNVNVRHIPGGNQDDVQFGGRGNYTLSVEAHITADASIATLRGLVGATARTLVYNGATYANTYLVGVSAPKRFSTATVWTVTLNFMRAGA